MSFVLFITCNLSKDIQCHAWPCCCFPDCKPPIQTSCFVFIEQSVWWLSMSTLIFLKGLCGYEWVNIFYQPWGTPGARKNVTALKTTHTREKCTLMLHTVCIISESLSSGIQCHKKPIKLFSQLSVRNLPGLGHLVSCMIIPFLHLQIINSEVMPQVNGQSAWWLQMVPSPILG